MKIALTGHRSEFFPDDTSFLPTIEGTFVRFLDATKPEVVISGGCYGWDLIGARESYFKSIPFDLYIPFPEFGNSWNVTNKELLRGMKPKARSIKNISDTYHSGCFYDRDKAMVDDADLVISLMHPLCEKGGTFCTVKYAKSLGKTVFNIWPKYDLAILSYIESCDLLGLREEVI